MRVFNEESEGQEKKVLQRDVITSNCFAFSNLNKKSYPTAEEGMFVLKEEGGDYSLLPDEFKAKEAAIVKYKIFWSLEGGVSKKPPFCASIVGDNSIRYNDLEKKYVQGPSCTGCPYFKARDARGNKQCKVGVLLYLVTEAGQIVKLFLTYYEEKALQEVLAEAEEGATLKVESKARKDVNGKYFVPSFSLVPKEEEINLPNFEEIKKEIEEGIRTMQNKQGGK